jgi:hypothetical protein
MFFLTMERILNKLQSRREFIKEAFAWSFMILPGLGTSGNNDHDPIEAPINSIFSNCTHREKEDAEYRVYQQILHYKSSSDLPKRIMESKKWEELIQSCAAKLNPQTEAFIVQYLSSLIFVESEGKPNAESGNGEARGLCQITWGAAKQAYNRFTLDKGNDLDFSLTKPEDLFDPAINISLSLIILQNYHKNFLDPSLVFWVYHFGEGNLRDAITSYYDSTNQEDEINNVRLNFIKLIRNKSVREKFNLDNKKSNFNDTEFYVPRIAAAKYFLI